MPYFAGSVAAQRKCHFRSLTVEVQHQFDISQPMQQAGMNAVQQMRKIQRPLRTFGPSPTAADKFSGSPMPHQTLNWLIKFHDSNFSRTQSKQKWGEARDFFS